jgi:anaerobic selenocysteine-containing dehydrogenase
MNGGQEKMEVVKTICTVGTLFCGLDVRTEDGKIVEVHGMEEHPVNQICVKAKTMPEWVHSERRLLNPLIKTNGKHKEASWDEALGFIADKLADIKKKYGARAFLPNVGNGSIWGLGSFMAKRFASVYGSPNFGSGGCMCFVARPVCNALTIGAHIVPTFNVDNNCIVVWGANPVNSFPPLKGDLISAMKGRGTKLIVIDPRTTETAKMADIHIQIRPGTDCALALGILNIIMKEELYDADFVKNWTVGFDELRTHVKEFTPEKVEEITWVPAKMVGEIAHMMATKGLSIVTGVGLDNCVSGSQTIRSIAIINAITGNVDAPGGSCFYPRFPINLLAVPERYEEKQSVGFKYPFFSRIAGGTEGESIVNATEQIITEKPYPIKALAFQGYNFILAWPNTNKVKEALKNIELLFALDIFPNETTEIADVVLPSASCLEREEIILNASGGRSTALITKGKRVIEPIGNSQPDWKTWMDLGKKMGYGEYFTWKNEKEIMDYILEPSGITYEQLDKSPGGVHYAPKVFKKYQKNGFPATPSHKVEIYSQQMKDMGYDPLPTYHEPAESPVNRPDLAKQYPLMLITGAKAPGYQNSRFHDIPRIKQYMPEALISIHSRTAGELGITDGTMVKVETQNGAINIKAGVTEDIHPQVVSIGQGWSEANVNFLTDDMKDRDPVTGYPNFRPLPCKVTKA